MWVFLASELLLFAGLFALFASYRALHPQGFHEAVAHSSKILGSINTAVLLVSSALVAGSVHALRAGLRRASAWLIVGTMALGLVFLFNKFVEYREHFADGIYPGGHGAHFVHHTTPGLATFWSLYFGMTGLHAIHVTVGLIILGVMVAGIRSGSVSRPMSHRLELAAIYWHLIDIIWIFLWPLFYLA
jgi:cytochrome c oxidase subunit 3